MVRHCRSILPTTSDHSMRAGDEPDDAAQANSTGLGRRNFPLPHHEPRARVQEHILIRTEGPGHGLALGILEVKFRKQARHQHLNLSNSKKPSWTGLVPVAKRKIVVRVDENSLVSVVLVRRGVPLAIAAHGIKCEWVWCDCGVHLMFIVGESNSAPLRDMRAVFQRVG